jgi:hypothetical protein
MTALVLRWRGPAVPRTQSGPIAAIIGPPGPAGPPGAGGYVEREAGEALGGHRVARIGGDGLARYASPAEADGIAGITVGAAGPGAMAQIVATGELVENGWAWSPGPIYLADAGTLSQTPPSSGAIVQIGTALGPHAMFVAPRLIAHLQEFNHG